MARQEQRPAPAPPPAPAPAPAAAQDDSVTKSDIVRSYLEKMGPDAKPKAIIAKMKADGVKTEISAQHISAVKVQLRKSQRRETANDNQPAAKKKAVTITLDAIQKAKEFVLAAGGLDNAKEIMTLLEAVRT